jgi:hypothetical protein
MTWHAALETSPLAAVLIATPRGKGVLWITCDTANIDSLCMHEAESSGGYDKQDGKITVAASMEDTGNWNHDIVLFFMVLL